VSASDRVRSSDTTNQLEIEMKRREPPKRRIPSAAALRHYGRKVEAAKKGGKFSRKVKHKKEDSE